MIMIVDVVFFWGFFGVLMLICVNGFVLCIDWIVYLRCSVLG